MMQKIIDNGCTVLLAEAGMMLTDDATFGTVVRLGKGDDGARWREVTEEEARALQAQEEAVADLKKTS